MRFYLFPFAILLVSARAQNDVSPTSSVDASTPASTSTSSARTSNVSTTEIPPATSTKSPVPSTQVPTWTVKSSNSTCILLRGNFTFAVTYPEASGNAASARVDIPSTATATGSCAPFLNSLVLTWGQGNLTFMFIKKPIYDAGVDTGNGSYSLTTIFGRLTLENSNDGNKSSTTPGQTFYISVKEPGFMTSTLHNSYSCESYQSVAADKTGSVYLEMTGVQVEAFHDGPAGDFSLSTPCSKDTLSLVLPIVGYVALAALISAVLGYIIWKKFRTAGYIEV